MLSHSPPSSLWLPLPPTEGIAAPENFGHRQISLDEILPCFPFGDGGHVSALDGEIPIVPAAVAEETNYDAAPAAPVVATHGGTWPASPIPGHQIPMEPTDNLSGGHSHSGDYGCPSGAFNQLDQEEDLMSSAFMLSDSLWLPVPPAEGLAAPENFGDRQISPLDEMPFLPAAVGEETNYAAAPAPLVATHGTGPEGQFSSISLSLPSTTSDQFDEEEVQQAMVPWQLLLHPLMAPDGLSNTTNGGPSARSHADAAPPLVQQGTRTTADELPHPQQQLPPAEGFAAPENLGDGQISLDEMPCIPFGDVQNSPMAEDEVPCIPAGVAEETNYAAAPAPLVATHGTGAGILIPAAPQDQEANIRSRTLTRRRPIKSRGRPQQDGCINLCRMGIEMMKQIVRHIGDMLKEENDRSIIVWPHFRWSRRKCCGTVTVICQLCYTVIIYTSTIEMLRHLESCDKFLASSKASKETQGSFRKLQITEIADGESEPIETDNSNYATAARVDTQGTNVDALSPWQQHQLIETFFSSEPCCPFQPQHRVVFPSVMVDYISPDEPDSWQDLIIKLSDGLCCSSTTKSTDDGFRLKISNKEDSTENICKVVHVDSSAEAWVNTYKDHVGLLLATSSDTIGSSELLVGAKYKDWASTLDGCSYPWQSLHSVLQSLGFRKKFATNLVMYAFGRVDECSLWLSRPCSRDKGKSIITVEQGDVPSAKQRQKRATWSKVWNHFTKEVVEAAGSTVTMARCNHCESKMRADSATHGTRHLAGHIRSLHPDKLAESPL